MAFLEDLQSGRPRELGQVVVGQDELGSNRRRQGGEHLRSRLHPPDRG